MDWVVSHKAAFSITVAAAAATAMAAVIYSRRKQWKKIGIVSKIYFHPVKSMKGNKIVCGVCTKQGLRLPEHDIYDRSFLVILPDGQMMTARREPELVLIENEVKDGFIKLKAPDTDPIIVQIPFNADKAISCRVFGEAVLGFDCGDDISKWLTDYFKTEYRLVYHPNNKISRGIFARDPKYGKLNAGKGKILYHDCSPLNILSQASIDDLNSRIDFKTTSQRFRPNILLEECSAYEEENWTHFKIGKAELQYVRKCTRCVFTTVDPATGEKHPECEPLETLRKYRLNDPGDKAEFGNSPPFGVALAAAKEGSINVGDVVYAC